MTDEKKCPEGQQWCEVSQKCVTPPGRGLKRGKQDGKQSQAGKLIEKYLNEATGGRELEHVIDNFVRYLIGDRQGAINALKKVANKDLGFEVPTIGKEFNDTFTDLFVDISKAIKKNLLWK